jgi:rubrerythrin
MGFNLDDYEPVEVRLEKYWKEHPDGRIETELLEASKDRFIVLARIYRTEADAKSWTTGIAEETVSQRGVNQTSALENCETSAIGRALANAGYATKGKRPSMQEMQKVVKANDKPTYGAPGSRSAAVADALRNTDWSAPKLEDPAPVSWTVNDVAATLNAETVFEKHYCQHGERLRKEGTSKTGKPYLGYVCTEKRKDDQCEPIWAKITANGKFYVPDPDKDK